MHTIRFPQTKKSVWVWADTPGSVLFIAINNQPPIFYSNLSLMHTVCFSQTNKSVTMWAKTPGSVLLVAINN